jgi:TolB protein
MRDSRMKLVLVREDGTEVKVLTDKSSRDIFPAWSPDGKKVVFTSRDAKGQGLFVIDSNGQHRRRLTVGVDSGAAWSPDGKTIAFTRYGRGGGQILAIPYMSEAEAILLNKENPTGDDVKKLTDGSAYDADIAWSPDGKKIAFASDRSGSFRLYIMDPDGKNVRQLTGVDNPGGNAYPAWSPDGKQIAYTNTAPDGSRQIFVIDSDGKNTKQLTSGGDFNCYAAWSPDGTKLAYTSFASRQSKGSLALMSADGSNPKIILHDQGVGHNGRPAWHPPTH